MAQHDYVIANGTGAAVRSDLNNALAAIVSQNSGATAPSTTYAYQWWADTTTGLLKLRNAANNAWITLFQLDGEWSTIALENGTAGAPSIYFKDSGTDTGVYSPGTDQVAISTGGTGRLFVDSSGRVGLGTSTPQLSIGAVGGNVLHVAGAGTTGLRIQNTGGNSVDIYAGTDGFINQSGSGTLNFQLAGSTKATLTSTGLGIGTTSPTDTNGYGTTLDIRGSSTGNGGVIYLRNSDATVTGQLAVYGDGRMDFGTTTNHPLKFYTNNTERGRWDNAGRFLVGTSSARSNTYNGSVSQIFQIEGNTDTGRGAAIFSTVNGQSGAYLLLGHSKSGTIGGNALITDGDDLGLISFQGNDGSEFVEGARIAAVVDGTSGANDLPTRLVFSTTADGASSPTERMRIVSGGNLIHGTIVASNGVGANTTNSGIEVGGGAVYHQVANNSSSGAIFTNYYRGSTVIGGISQNGTTGVTYATTSDYRLKENVEPITGAADRVLQLKPSRFNFIAAPDRIVDGFIAHEAQIVVPECATGTKDEMDDDGNPVYQGIDQSKLVPLLTAALQEALAEITSLKDRVAALEAS